MDKLYDLVALGEYLVDFSPAGEGKMGNPQYEMNPGGAPTNCLAACTALGGRTAVIAAVGDDLFGRFLKQKVRDAGIDARGIQTVPQSTTLVFVSVDGDGEREFAFVRQPGADTCIAPERIPLPLLERTRYFHFGSLSLTAQPARGATEFAVDYARRHGALISYDPNYRAALWGSEAQARERLLWGVGQADLVKMSDGELALLTGFGADSVDKGADAVLAMGVKELFVTAGSEGAYYFTPSRRGHVPGFAVNAADCTGCGDAFTGAMLYQCCHTPARSIEERTRFANAVGALCATRPGGMCAMPAQDQVLALLSQA